ncbi:hypothetical protein ACF07B_42580 [Streptomyces sp. NPDC015532]|uniref:hypothetical protein n=1 Tax=Streptomyces sp. NPDC015532 TaxID=3364960 RepID=UPI0036FAC41C
MKPEQDSERTPSRETAAMKGRVTPVPPGRSSDDRADENRGEAEEVSRREALKGHVDPASTETAPGTPDKTGTVDRNATVDRNGAPDRNGALDRSSAPDKTGTLDRNSSTPDRNSAPDRNGGRATDGDGRAVRPAGTGATARATTGADLDEREAPGDDRTGRTGAGAASRASGTPGGSGQRPAPRDAGGTPPGSGSADTEDRAGDSAGRDERMLPLDEHDKFSLRMRHAVGGFVDGPQAAVEEADHVLEELAGRFTEAVTRRRRDLRTSWKSGGEGKATDPDTEQLRLALRDYREMTERLLRL